MSNWEAVDTELRAIVKARGKLDVDEGRLLLIARRESVHAHVGYATFHEYMERALGYDPHTVNERLRVAEWLAQLPMTRDAVAEGRLAYSGARELTRILIPETEEIWLEATKDRTVREIEGMVAGRKRGDLPDTPVDPVVRPRWVRFELAPETYALLREARKVVQETTGSYVSDDHLVRAMCEAVLQPGASEHTHAPYQIAMTVCRECDRGQQDGGGVTVDVSQAVVEEALCDGDVISGDEPSRVRTCVPRKVRRHVVRRAHGRCQVPGCRATRFLHIHHLDHDPSNHDVANLVLVCGAHHRLHHHGMLLIEREGDELTWRHADGRRYGAPPTYARTMRAPSPVEPAPESRAIDEPTREAG